MTSWLRALVTLPAAIVCGASYAHAQSITRVEQNDPSIVYSGNWYTNTNALDTGGLAALTNTKGARVSLTFTGSGITWRGFSDGWAGLATVYLDGTMTIVDTYSTTTQFQRPLFSVQGLGAGAHTISIEVTHERGPGTEGSWVWLDAFDIESGAPVPGGVTATAGRIEENDPSIVLTGRWFSNANAIYSGGGALLAMDAGSQLTVKFNGSGIVWLATCDEWSGLARVYVDGEAKTTIDNYRSTSEARTALYSLWGLAPGPHTFTIEVTGTRSSNAKAPWVWVDAFDIVR